MSNTSLHISHIPSPAVTTSNSDGVWAKSGYAFELSGTCSESAMEKKNLVEGIVLIGPLGFLNISEQLILLYNFCGHWSST